MRIVTARSLAATVIVVMLAVSWSRDLAGDQPGQPAGADDIQTFFKHYSQAMRKGDSAALAASMHPDALDQLKEFLMVLAAAKRSGPEIKAGLGVTEASAVADIAPSELCRRFMGAVYRHPEAKAALEAASLGYIGVVSEGELRHVVYRATYGNEEEGLSMVDVITLKRDEKQWKALMTTEFQSMLEDLAEKLDE